MLHKNSTSGPVLVDEHGLPRYWAAVWALLHGGDLAPTTLAKKLGHIEALYQHTESLGGSLDDLLEDLELDRLGNALEAFFVSLRNIPVPTTATANRWKTAFHFVRDTCQRLERNPAIGNKMAGIQERIGRLDNLYLGLRPYKPRYGRKPRAIPRIVISELLEAIQPESPKNPFSAESTKWRVLVLVNLLLLQGLRRGEALSLPADFLKFEKDPRTGTTKWRLSVRTNEFEDDSRADPPSIKTVDSIRTIPIAEKTAHAFLTYSDNFRGKVDHKYYLSSVRSLPMSLEGATKSLEKLSQCLSEQAKSELFYLTGARVIRPHALRHTSAVIRMKQLLSMGNTPEQAMMHMRSFYGWSKTSVMPLHYAKAALDERLNESWNDEFDGRLEILRSLPQ